MSFFSALKILSLNMVTWISEVVLISHFTILFKPWEIFGKLRALNIDDVN